MLKKGGKILKIKNLTAAALTAAMVTAPNMPSYAYTAQKGDTYWKISQKYGVSMSDVLKANGKTESSVLNIGDDVLIPGIDVHIVKSGDTYWKISKKYNVDFDELLLLNGADSSSWLNIGQVVYLKDKKTETNLSNPWISYNTYTAASGDDLWTLSQKFGIPYTELCEVNNMGDNTVIYVGMKIKVPVHHVPETPRVSDSYGEYLDWWTQAQYVIPIGTEFTVKDFYSGKTFKAKRTTGANHADCEPLTASDTSKMKAIWGGAFTWDTRPVIIIAGERYIAASAASYEHGGNENAAGGLWTSWRSGDYGAGYNYREISDLMDVSPQTLRKRMERIKTKLAEILSRENM